MPPKRKFVELSDSEKENDSSTLPAAVVAAIEPPKKVARTVKPAAGGRKKKLTAAEENGWTSWRDVVLDGEDEVGTQRAIHRVNALADSSFLFLPRRLG